MEGQAANITTSTSRITLGLIVSTLIFFIIVSVIYAPEVTLYLGLGKTDEPYKFEIPLISPYFTSRVNTNDGLAEYAQENTGVSGYSTDVYVSFENSTIHIGDKMRLHVQVINHGTDLHKPYFSILLLNNTGQVVATFPDGTSLSQDYSYSSKPDQWWTGGVSGYDYWVPIRNADGSMTGYSVSRDALIAGKGTFQGKDQYEGEMWFAKQIAAAPTQIGQWTAWVFVYDDQYSSPTGSMIQTDNAITYTKAVFNVVGKDAPETQAKSSISVLNVSSFIITLGLFIISTYGLFAKLAPWIDSHASRFKAWSKRDRYIFAIAVVLVIAYIALYASNPSHF